MKRIDTSTRAIDLFGAGKDGYKDGNKGAGIPATDLNASVLNAMQEEIANVIEGAGAALNPADNTQLLQAINSLVKGPADKIVRVASTAAINLAAPGANIDGTVMVAGDTFLEKDNATLANRGIYVWNGAAVPATRDPSADNGAELFGGMIIRVKEGAVNADSNWQVTNDGVVTVGVTGLTFQKVGASAVITAASNPTFIDNSASAASTSWVRSAISALAVAAGFSYSFTPNGFLKFPNWFFGFVIQWGSTSAVGVVEADISPTTFPLAFPNACFKVVATKKMTSGVNDDVGVTITSFSATSVTFRSEQFDAALGAGTRTFEYIAVGH